MTKSISDSANSNPGPNPSVKENPENALYEVWKVSESWARPEIEKDLLQHLRRHASKVCWLVLNSYQPHLIDEIAVDTLMDLKSFEERSAFSTWVHSRALKRCYMERRTQKSRRETPYELATLQLLASVPRSSQGLDIETAVVVREMLDKLSEKDKQLVQFKVFDGLSDEEVSKELGIPRSTVQFKWKKLRNRMRILYHGRTIAK